VALLVVSISIAAAGVILQLVAWTGALFNTHLLAGKTWFRCCCGWGSPGS
jgi:hypothetical protein